MRKLTKFSTTFNIKNINAFDRTPTQSDHNSYDNVNIFFVKFFNIKVMKLKVK